MSVYRDVPGTVTVGSHPVVCRVVKGVFENRPSLPKYQETWDVDSVVDYLAGWAEACRLDLKHLTRRLVMLLALLSGQRGYVKMGDNKCTIVYSSVLKQSKSGKHIRPLDLMGFENKKLCIVTHLKEYLQRTKSMRKGKELFISYIEPHNHISRGTLSRWIKMVLELSGVDVTKFSAHSTRAASTSAAFSREVPLDTIMTAAGWSRQKTFTQVYCKAVSTKNFSRSVLDSFVNKTS